MLIKKRLLDLFPAVSLISTLNPSDQSNRRIYKNEKRIYERISKLVFFVDLRRYLGKIIKL